ncbi:rhamnulokinase [Paenibacillus sp. SEL3]
MIDHIAVDIGASSGRLVLGKLKEGKLILEEIHRFQNGFTERSGAYFWDIDYLLEQIIVGLKKAKRSGIRKCTLGIDTWAVDYVLLDANGNRIQEVYSYRDPRTDHIIEEINKLMSPSEIYAKTGIQQLSFNTLNQLYAHQSEELAQADKILMVPDYLYYRLSGRKMNEVTNVSTTQLLNLRTREFDDDLLHLLQLKREQFAELVEPSEVLGFVNEDLVKEYDLPECLLICVATHDTASAVLGVPSQSERTAAYISSGTWSLLGVELDHPINSQAAMQANYTNEWGAFGTYRFLKNIMGLWMIQEVRRQTRDSYSFAELAELATDAQGFRSLIPCNDARFLNPYNMAGEIRSSCLDSGQPIPHSIGEIARCIFDSLALSYRSYLIELEEIIGSTIEVVQIVGGGANNVLLCQLTADITGKEVQAGPTEATAIGNLAVQLIRARDIPNIHEVRKIIANSFEIKSYKPRKINGLQEAIQRWDRIHKMHNLNNQ